MGKSLYRSHRSKSFDEIVGQDHITQTLKNSLKTGSISHAYLLSGPRGTGKTSVARILAYEVNQTPYETETTHLDIIEIDAASNRRIDEVREIREKVAIAPSQGKYKVYIIDEVHMLTREAFNALLKTLEEPPDHAIFILATTETNKVPETILSRCIQFNFKPIETSILATHLREIAEKESINITEDAVNLLAEHARGSFRDGISLLEQVSNSSDKVNEAQVIMMLGMASKDSIYSIAGAVNNTDLQLINSLLSQIYSSGADASTVASQLQEFYRNKLLEGHIDENRQYQVADLIERLLGVSGSSKPRIILELILMKFALESKGVINSPVIDAPAEHDNRSLKSSTGKETEPLVKKTPKKAELKISVPKIQQTDNKESPHATESDLWSSFLIELKNRNNTLHSIAKVAKVEIVHNRVELIFKYSFHLKQINEPKNKALFSELLSELNESPIELVARQSSESDEPSTPHSTQAPDIDLSLQNVSNIFGGHEVLES